MIFVGHTRVRRELEHELPPVALLLGPESVGKWTLARHLAWHHKVQPGDRLALPTLTMDKARMLRQFMTVAPLGRLKVAVLNLDQSTEDSQNVLLKVLEEPPPTARFLLVASTSYKVLPTILSRSHVYQLGLLSEDEIYEILTRRFDVAPQKAKAAAQLADGSMSRALRELADKRDTARATALSVLKAVADHDPDLLARAMRTVDHDGADAVRGYLVRWAREALTERWRVFTEAESFGLDQDEMVPKRILLALSTRSLARSKLALRVAMEPLTVR